MSGWVFSRLDAATGSAGSYVDAPWRILLHTTETTADPRNWVPNWPYPSHLVADFERQSIYQCIPFNEAAKALYNAAGGVETNRQRCIQVELNGNAAEAADWSDNKLAWIGRAVVAPIVAWVRSQGGDIDLDDVPEPGPIPNSAREDAPQRMSFARWDAFAGVCGHRHAPENDHWDGGGLNMRRIAFYAKAALNPSQPAPIPTAPPPDDPEFDVSITIHTPNLRPDAYQGKPVLDFPLVPAHAQRGYKVMSNVALVVSPVNPGHANPPFTVQVHNFDLNGSSDPPVDLTVMPWGSVMVVGRTGRLSVVFDAAKPVTCEVREAWLPAE